jgi:hypothetical protein
MKPEPLDYRPIQPHHVPIAPLIVAAVVIASNGLLMATAIYSGGWIAMWIVRLVGPGVNTSLALIGFYLSPKVLRMPAGKSKTMYLTAILLPLAAIIFDYALTVR